MNTKILQKILDELSKETPDISYVKGILQTLLDLADEGSKTVTNKVAIGMNNPVALDKDSNQEKPKNSDEGSMMDTIAKAKVAQIKRLAEQGLE